MYLGQRSLLTPTRPSRDSFGLEYGGNLRSRFLRSHYSLALLEVLCEASARAVQAVHMG